MHIELYDSIKEILDVTQRIAGVVSVGLGVGLTLQANTVKHSRALCEPMDRLHWPSIATR